MKSEKKLSVILRDEKAWVLILVAFICLYYWRYMGLKNITVVDEYESLAVPFGLLSKVRWGSVYSFHGFGMTILATPIIWLLKHQQDVYIVFLIQALLERILIGLCIFFLETRIQKKNPAYATLIAVVAEVGMLGSTTCAELSAMTEIPLMLVSVLVVFLTYVVVHAERSKKVILATFVLSGVLAYSFTIHTRGVVLVVSSLLVIGLDMIRKKSVKKEYISFLIFPILYKGVNCFIEFIQNRVYSSDDINNHVSDFVPNVRDTSAQALHDHVLVMIKIFFSNIEGWVYWSLGIVVLMVLVNLFYIFGKLEKNDFQWSLSVFALVSFFLMNIIVAYVAYDNIIEGKYYWLVYVRYASPFAFLLGYSGFSIILTRGGMKKTYAVSWVITIVMCKHFLMTTVAELDRNHYGLNAINFNQFELIKDTSGSATTYFRSLFIIIIIIATLGVALKKKGVVLAAYLALSVVAGNGIYNTAVVRDAGKTDFYKESLRVIQNIDFGDIDGVYITGDDWRYNKCLTARLGYINDQGYEEDSDLSNSVCFSNEKLYREDKVYELQLSKTEYMYTQNKEIFEKVLRYYATE